MRLTERVLSNFKTRDSVPWNPAGESNYTEPSVDILSKFGEVREEKGGERKWREGRKGQKGREKRQRKGRKKMRPIKLLCRIAGDIRATVSACVMPDFIEYRL